MKKENQTNRQSVIKLGLPPMELAESTRNNDQNVTGEVGCLFPVLQKLVLIVLLLILGAGTYILMMKLLNSAESTRSTEVIIVTAIDKNSNVTIQDKMDVMLHLDNIKGEPNKIRGKRHANNAIETEGTGEEIIAFNEYQLQIAKAMIKEHNLLCQQGHNQDVCETLIKKIKLIADKNKSSSSNKDDYIENNIEKNESYIKENGLSLKSVNFKKREAPLTARLQNIIESVPHLETRDRYGYGHINPGNIMPQQHQAPLSPLSDTCLLARLLKHNYPHIHGLYDSPNAEYTAPNYEHPASSNHRYYSPIPSQSYIHGRDVEEKKTKLHPQDVDIFMSFLTPKQVLLNDRPLNSTLTEESKCLPGTFPCDSESVCISEAKLCDGNVDCPDASDEINCACKSRVDKARLCDGYFDCPFGEDEMGCFGCQENGFSCNDLDINSHSTCFTKEQRCDNVADCPNHKDEIECTMLAPGLLKKSLFAISNTEGFLHRNFKGEWHAVCQNPYMWAHDACRRETGLIIRPPFIQVLQIDPLLKVSYLNTGPGGLMQIADTCFNSSAIYVTCPDLLCGTRVLSTSQLLLRENMGIENRLFGRNKRFLMSGRPYPLYFYENRKKRQTNMFYLNGSMDNYFDSESLYYRGLEHSMRNIRAQSRVVGGKPSLPAAWPWMVAIYRNGMFHCGGVVITQNWIMSAAHCVHKFWDNYYEVQVGMLRRFSFSPQEHNHKVTHIIVNQHYRQEDMKNDLSLLRVEPVIQFSRWVRPICLPGPDTAGPDWLWGPSPDTICTAVGWGATIEHGPDPDHMREVEVPIWEHCKHREDRAGKEICAGPVEGGKDACQGDSGGPLLCRNPLNSQQWYIAGIVSHGDGCARKDEPGVYTRVSLFVKWIKYHISSNSLPIVMPVQECPGFKCKSGLSKCIPNKRKCDKIVDCLGAEDEIGCNKSKSQSTFSGNNIFLTEMFKSNDNISNIEKNRKAKDTTTDVTEVIDITKNIETNEISTTVASEDAITTTITSHTLFTNNEKIVSTTTAGPISSETFVNDLQHASTLEMPYTHESEEFHNNSSKTVTENVIISTTIEEVEQVSQVNMETVTISFSKDSLESRSSVIKTSDTQDINNDNENINNLSLFSIQSTTTESVTTDQFDEQIIDSTTPMVLNNIVQLNDLDEQNVNPNNANDNSKEKSDELDDKFHINTETSTLNETVEKHDKVENKSNEQQTYNQLTDSNDIDQESTATSLTDFVNQSNTIETFVFSELEPAKIRRKHRIPKEFECARIYQVIPYNQRCNHKADCEDGTDELDCTCIDYISTFNVKLLCDGFFDCADGQDEIDCYNCPQDHFLCKRSHNCVHMKHVCDGIYNCPHGDDEIDCYTLTNGKELLYGPDKRPKLNIEGYVTKRHQNEWHVVCDDKMTLQEVDESATHICHYLGFSSAYRYFIKHINIKDDESLEASSEIMRKKRELEGVPVHFSYRNANTVNKTTRQIFIKDPQVIDEICVPNITKTCKSLYVICDRSLFTDFNTTKELSSNKGTVDLSNYMWPWIAKIFVEGEYKCTGVLVDLSWVVASHSCFWETTSDYFITVVLGSHKILNNTNGFYEQVYKVNAKKDLYRNKITLLHLKTPAKYSNMVKPMILTNFFNQPEQNHVCVTVGQDYNNATLNVFLEETNENCNSHNICFKRKGMDNICPNNIVSKLQWAGIISCHSQHGWNPIASFVDSRGECGLGDHITATDIENLKREIKFLSKKKIFSDSIEQGDNGCEGQRCSRGRCIDVHHLCDGVRQCEDGIDESEEACYKKNKICEHDPYHKGCGCTIGEMKCRNGKCIAKELFRDGHDDCGDGTDEPVDTTCSDYLARVMPSRLCDGILHCHDRSDENPMFCRCYAKRTYKCGKSTPDIDRCVAPDMVCDGIRDCPNGEDERTCIGLSAPDGTQYGSGQVLVRSHGVWYSKCYSSPNHTKSELEEICRELGFLSGHAREIKNMDNHPHNNLLLHPFSDVVLNNSTVIKMRNTDEPIAKPVFNETLKDCYPVFIECI